MNRIILSVLAIGALSVTLTGCTPPERPDVVSTPTPVDNFEGQMMTYVEGVSSDGSSYSFTALLNGTLTLHNDCLALDEIPMIFPKDASTWDGETLTVGETKVQLGDELSLGGGISPASTLKENHREDVLEKCGDGETISVAGITAP